MKNYRDIDIELEKIIFLINADEGNHGLFELILELSIFNITIDEKYKIAKQILIEFIQRNFIVFEEFENSSLEKKIRIISTDEVYSILDNPYYWWYPCNDNKVIIITLTSSGESFLDKEIPKIKDKIRDRYRIL